ncbi:DUF4229 domain-containing protein [Fodinicola acaciae]|uniref:DUF4229 domain-containing protein n=1 Tax=Fodinicola acaciae TaxID=2681555 RepID=UPI0013CFECFB|nr:DUF4229 domain-containing protein [Fodinicola acaciae]
MLAVLRYTFWRLLVFAGCLGVLYVAGLRRWALVLVALLISMPVAYVLLRRQTSDFATSLGGVLARRRAERDRLRAALKGEDEPAAPIEKRSENTGTS